MIPIGVPGTSAGPAEGEPSGVHRMEAVDVLGGADRLDHGVLVEVVGHRQLDEQPVDGVVGVDLGDEREQRLLARVRRQVVIERLESGLPRGLVLAADVDLRGGILADEDRGEADVAEPSDVGGHLGAHLRRERLAVDERRCHGR